MEDLFDISSKILDLSDGGLDIIMELFPQAKVNKEFKIRDERTPSVRLKKLGDGNWVLTDFGGDGISKNAIQLYAEEKRLKWSEAVFELASKYGISIKDKAISLSEPEFKTYQVHDFPNELNEDGYFIETSEDFTEVELKTLGPFVDKATCKICNCYKVISYAFKSIKEGRERIVEIRSKSDFPIFAFVNKHDGKNFYKIYQPKAQDKNYRFRYFGGRPKNFVNGLDRLKSEYAKKEDEYNRSLNDDSVIQKPKAPEKIDKVLICSGERDALNAASLGYFVLWHNSETAEWSRELMKALFKRAEEIINIPDIDRTGIAQGRALAMKYLSIKTMWLPSWLSELTDWRGFHRKDLTDYFHLNRNLDRQSFLNRFKDLLTSAHPLQFWIEKYSEKGIRYEISNALLYNFLQQNGFWRCKSVGSKSGYCFIQIKQHKVDKIETDKIYAFLKQFMEERNLPVALKDALMNTSKISEQKLSWLDLIELNFRTSSFDKQIFSFSHGNWVITKDSIKKEVENNDETHVWEDEVIDAKINKEREEDLNSKKIEIEDSYFDITKNGDDYDISIKEENCDIFNFLINTSRVHWKHEFIDSWISENQDWEDAYSLPENIEYREKNKTNISGERLTSEQIIEQKNHLVNKIFAVGYMLHTYKNAGKPWAVYCMENEVVEDGESKGGTGKSLVSTALSYLLKTKYLPARNKDLFANQFLYDGVDEYTDMIWFDDADRNFRLANIYSEITGPLTVNAKFSAPYTIPFYKSPKLLISSNYPLRDSDPSTLRRLLFVAFSDYFHVASDDLPGNTPDKVFGHQLFQDWDDSQWNKFFNFMAQCVQFYLGCKEKINPPMEQLTQRNLINQIGPVFIEWAEEFFRYLIRDQNNVVEFEKIATIEKLKMQKASLSKITSNKFTKKLRDYCKLNGFIYMPGSKRIQKPSVADPLKVVDWIAIKVDEIDENLVDYDIF